MARIWPPVGPQNLPGPFDPDWAILDTPDSSSWVSSSSGSAATTEAVRALYLITGSTASSTCQLSTTNPARHGFSRGKDQNVIDWSKRVVLWLEINIDANTSTGVFRVKFGEASNDAVGDQAVKGIGIKVAGLALSGVAHDGTTLDTVSLTTLTLDDTALVVIDSDGKGNVRFYVDTGSGLVLKGTSTGGPSAESSANENGIILEATNGTNSADYRAGVHRLIAFVKQT